mgnify:FL=1
MTFTCHYDSPLGGITLAATESGLCGLWFDGQKYFGHGLKEEAMTKETPLLLQTRQWLDVYFSGQQPDFCPPLQPSGTHFQQTVWQILSTILRRNPYLQRYSHGNRPPFRTASHGSTSCRQCHRTQSHQHPDSLPPHSRKQWKPDRIRRRHLAQAVTFRYRTYTLLYKVKSYEILPSLLI